MDAAHAKNVDQRNTELRHIANSLLSRDKSTRDLTVWLGDLNYRIQDVSNLPARSLIHNHLQSVSPFSFSISIKCKHYQNQRLTHYGWTYGFSVFL